MKTKIISEQLLLVIGAIFILLLFVVILGLNTIADQLEESNLMAKSNNRLIGELKQHSPLGDRGLEKELSFRTLTEDQVSTVLIYGKVREYKNVFAEKMIKTQPYNHRLVMIIAAEDVDKEVKDRAFKIILERKPNLETLQKVGFYNFISKKYKERFEKELK